ncbi:hypothetical protein TG1_44 [Streptomyces phage TG1]|uniref:Uncharacterized protein n=1 Tax=Streptomyces phage TG1 TaxID=2927987 RepID=K4IBQ9_9CAUD|nr:hypothetical protein D281_gp44 [Streptomyces phage TG1]AFU62239.1 hypothetical protein TG1_44 [Streptomyces phage TG1]
MRNSTFAASLVATAGAALGLGFVLDGERADSHATPNPAVTVTETPDAPESAQGDADGTQDRTDAGQSVGGTVGAPNGHAESARARTVEAGDAGPLKDAQGDGKVLDDMGKAVMPGGVGLHISDDLLPFPGEYVEPEADDVVSAPNVITDPDKPWFDLPEEPVTADVESAPMSTASVESSGPVRQTAPAPRPSFNWFTPVSKAEPVEAPKPLAFLTPVKLAEPAAD